MDPSAIEDLQNAQAYQTSSFVEYLPDTGASSHMFSDPSLLQQAHSYQGTEKVIVGDGTKIPITHKGTSTLQTPEFSFNLPNVLCVPNIKKNLLSVAKFTNDNQCFFEFFPWGYAIKEIKTGRTLLEGRVHGNLYPILLPRPQLQPQLESFLAVTGTSELWHQRLGHPAPPIAQHLPSNQLIQLSTNSYSSKLCCSCQMGKSKRLPFSNSTRVTSNPLELVHCDIWGPSPTVSNSGFRYYILFVDDF